tara:strand:- start:1495 stop:1668 length:174 start_codon:yes stop_codon:yes gene_type:complete
MSVLKQLMTENADLKVENATLKQRLYMREQELTDLWSQSTINQYESSDEYLEAKGDN